ncbi:hypothetical protein MOBT1_003014 [Malassezia obtusa]|uniref:Nitroreductase domain-containing protein n=1 Tax=Malassezia obtusa TaxID=76774 RepID=A0AAF0IT76_9BASI|nr:hypothetical protein MOBT1_003014 [Malassezia obtusa]
MATTQTAKEFIRAITQRRSVYALSNKPVQSPQRVNELVKVALREAPSSFNIQSSRAAILTGKEHLYNWKEIVPSALLKAAGQTALDKSRAKLDMFAAGTGTILFYEDLNVVKGIQEKFPLYADSFPIWSRHSSGMAQIYTWTLLEAEGFGANLQHYGNLTQEMLAEKYNIPKSWQLQAEMVFGHPEKPAGEKSYMPDHERVLAFGDDTQ